MYFTEHQSLEREANLDKLVRVKAKARRGKTPAIVKIISDKCINPREYLEDVMRRIMSHNASKLYELLPDEWLKAHNSKPPSPL